MKKKTKFILNLFEPWDCNIILSAKTALVIFKIKKQYHNSHRNVETAQILLWLLDIYW